MIRSAIQECLSRASCATTLSSVGAALTLAMVCLVAAPLAATAENSAEEARRAERLLIRAGVTPNADGAIRFLNRLRPTAETKQTVAQLIGKLGHQNYLVRKGATEALEQLGAAAETQLVAASKNVDLEVAMRARRLMQLIRHARDSELHDQMLSAALRILGRERHQNSTGTILQTIPMLEREAHIDEACVALWFSATKDVTQNDIDRIRQALQHGNDGLKVAAIPALEVAVGAAAVTDLQAFLSHKSDQIRLAAARALIDRVPLECIPVLVRLLESENSTVQLRAAWLLGQVFGELASEDAEKQFSSQANALKQRAKNLAASELRIPLGARRLQLSQFSVIFREQFARKVASIKDRYGEFRYETTIDGARASVSDGMLRLHGDHNEGDQRLFITARQLTGKDQFTKPFEVVADIGGEALGSGTYHVGVSVGNLRVLFHPGYHQGGFRIERVDNHAYKVSNQSMTFTPAGGTLHKMRVSVTPQKDKSVQLKATVINGQNPNQKFVKTYLAQSGDIGPLTRVALERSGRVGGAALFGSLEIDTTGVDR